MNPFVRWLLDALLRRQVTGDDLAQLARAGRMGGPDRLQQMYEWHTARLNSFAKGIAAALVTLLTTIIVAFLKTEIRATIEPWEAALFGAGVLLSSSYAAYIAWRVSRLPSEYAAALHFYEILAQGMPGFPPKPWS